MVSKPVKITIITTCSVIGVIFLILLSYFLYLLASYKRLDDNLILHVDVRGKVNGRILTNTTYSIMTYNIGFGASDSDFSFFMDGGKYSKATSKKNLEENMEGIANDISGAHPDILMIQEVDMDGTRSYHFNETSYLIYKLQYGNYVYAENYDSPYIFYPIFRPFGANEGGILTATSFNVTSALRRRLPISKSLSKLLDLDRCYSISRISVSNGKELCIYNLHLSAYGSGPSIRENQLKMLTEDIEKDIKKGNYVICGGDFNHNLRNATNEKVPGWAQPFPHEVLPDESIFGFKIAEICNIEHNSCRNLDTAYKKDKTFTVLIDGFIVTKNIKVLTYTSLDWQYENSDHDPVFMTFQLLDQD